MIQSGQSDLLVSLTLYGWESGGAVVPSVQHHTYRTIMFLLSTDPAERGRIGRAGVEQSDGLGEADPRVRDEKARFAPVEETPGGAQPGRYSVGEQFRRLHHGPQDHAGRDVSAERHASRAADREHGRECGQSGRGTVFGEGRSAVGR